MASPLVAPRDPRAIFKQFKEIAAMNRLAGKEMPMFASIRFSRLAFKEINDSAARNLDLAEFEGRDGAGHDEEYHAPRLKPKRRRFEHDSG